MVDGEYITSKKVNRDTAHFYLAYKDCELVDSSRYAPTKWVEYQFTYEGLLASLMARSCIIEDAKSFVYFVFDEENIKIGIANNVKQRIKELQTSNARKLELLALIPTSERFVAFDIEKDLHIYFEPYNCNGEWYRLKCNEDLAKIIDAFARGKIMPNTLDLFTCDIHNMFNHICDAGIDHPISHDTVSELMSFVIQTAHKYM